MPPLMSLPYCFAFLNRYLINSVEWFLHSRKGHHSMDATYGSVLLRDTISRWDRCFFFLRTVGRSSSKPVWISLFFRTQRKIFWRECVSVSGAPLTSMVFFSYYGSQWCPRTALFPTFFRTSSFVFSRTKTFIQVWNYLRVSKQWQNFLFWVNYPFNSKYFFYMIYF